jgi:hypothetical protein
MILYMQPSPLVISTLGCVDGKAEVFLEIKK